MTLLPQDFSLPSVSLSLLGVSSVSLCVSYSKSQKEPLTCLLWVQTSWHASSVAKLWTECPGSQMPILDHYLWSEWQCNETQSLAIIESPPRRGLGYEKRSEISPNGAKQLAKTIFFLSRKLATFIYESYFTYEPCVVLFVLLMLVFVFLYSRG